MDVWESGDGVWGREVRAMAGYESNVLSTCPGPKQEMRAQEQEVNRE